MKHQNLEREKGKDINYQKMNKRKYYVLSIIFDRGINKNGVAIQDEKPAPVQLIHSPTKSCENPNTL